MDLAILDIVEFMLLRRCYVITLQACSIRPLTSLIASLVSRIDRLADLEKKTGYPKAYYFSAIASLFSLLISALGGMKLISDLIGFLYPTYMSFKAIESRGTEDDTQWLTYWVVFATFSILEATVMFVLEYIPFYFVVKTCFMGWLFHPKFMGAALVYKQIK